MLTYNNVGNVTVTHQQENGLADEERVGVWKFFLLELLCITYFLLMGF